MTELEKYRGEIDEIDDSILCLLSERMEIARKIGEYKKDNSIATVDKTRFAQLLKDLKSKAKDYNLKPEMIEKIYNILHDYSVEVQDISTSSAQEKV